MDRQRNKLPEYNRYSLDNYMMPIWGNGIVYNESVMFVPNPVTGAIDPAPLLYKPDKIFSVFSADYVKQYIEGKDYIVEDFCLRLTHDGSIPVWHYNDYYLPQPASIPISSVNAPGRFVLYADGSVFSRMQLAVTYSHTDVWEGEKPEYAGDKLINTVMKLQKKEPLLIVYFGDSIVEGCEASGRNMIRPYMPVFTEMVTEKLRIVYGYQAITEKNMAVGGKDSEWGKRNAGKYVADYAPDLVVIGFGMNDSGANITVNEYEQNIRSIIETTRFKNPKAEFILISPSIPNPDCQGWTNLQPQYQTGLENIVRDMEGTAIAPVTKVQAYLLRRKRYEDMNGNGVNHPNDFFARIYAQTVARCLIPENTEVNDLKAV